MSPESRAQPVRHRSRRHGPLLGAHVSVAGGLDRAFDHARRLRCSAIQIFVKNANRWQQRRPSEEEVAAFRRRRETSEVRVVLAHASYLINVASPSRELRERSAAALADELDRCQRLGVDALVLHPGSHVGTGSRRAIARAARVLARTVDRHGAGVRLLLENTAGQGSSLGVSADELLALLDAIGRPERTGVCLDTCHAFAAGWAIHLEADYERIVHAIVEGPLGPTVRALHLNDSKLPFGCRRDRHANLGRGEIGSPTFRRLVTDHRLRTLPMILETPTGEDLSGYRRDLALLRRMSAPGARS